MMSQAAASAALRRCLQSRRQAFTSLGCTIYRRPRTIYSATATLQATERSVETCETFTSQHHQHHHQHQRRKYSNTPHHLSSTSSDNESSARSNYWDDPSYGYDKVMDSDDMEFYDDMTETFDYQPTDEDEELRKLEEEEARRQAVRDELDSRTGRLWTDPWEITDEDWSAGLEFDDLPDWTTEICSRVSLERVQLHPDGLPTLEKLASTPLPPAQCAHPALGNPHPYLKHRKKAIFKAIVAAVEKFAAPKMERILAMEDWEAKQEAIDDLFEKVYDAVKGGGVDADDEDGYVSVVLGHQPNFPELVESALTEYLKKVVKDERIAFDKTIEEASGDDGDDNDTDGDTDDDTDADTDDNADDNTEEEIVDEDAVPVFMELGAAEKGEVVPKILQPLKPHPKDGPGRMVEEWELSANENTRRIMCRQSIREIARALVEEKKGGEGGATRVYVKGQKGSGKSAALAAIVASARTSGHIVLWLPDGDRLRKLGFYTEPNNHAEDSEGPLFDLPVLSKEICGQLIEAHGDDFEGMQVSKECLDKHVGKDSFRRLTRLMGEIDDTGVSISELLKIGSENVSVAANCYSSAMDTLMNQESKPFTIVVDDFNCFYDYGHYFHMDYDPEVKRPIPLHRMTLFKPLTDAIGVVKLCNGKFQTNEPVEIKNGGIVVGTTESHAVARKFTTALTDCMNENGTRVVTVPPYSPLEVEHILANFEIAGVGRLRFDRGATVMNEQEVRYLRMVSGGYGQALLDACCW